MAFVVRPLHLCPCIPPNTVRFFSLHDDFRPDRVRTPIHLRYLLLRFRADRTARLYSGPIASASAWLPLLYDTLILILTLNRTLKPVRHRTAGKIMKVLLRDGILYYRSVRR